jgi:hypothetical protein
MYTVTKILDHYFRVLDVVNVDDTKRHLILDRSVTPPRTLLKRLWWLAKDEWYKIQWSKTHDEKQ